MQLITEDAQKIVSDARRHAALGAHMADARINGIQCEINNLVSIIENDDGSAKEHTLSKQRVLQLRDRTTRLTCERYAIMQIEMNQCTSRGKGSIVYKIRQLYAEKMSKHI